MNTRRIFILKAAALAGMTSNIAIAQTSKPNVVKPSMPMVDPASALAKGLKYTEDFKADPYNVKENRKCSTCTLFQAKPTDKTGPCVLFKDQLVVSDGWCQAYVKKT